MRFIAEEKVVVKNFEIRLRGITHLLRSKISFKSIEIGTLNASKTSLNYHRNVFFFLVRRHHLFIPLLLRCAKNPLTPFAVISFKAVLIRSYNYNLRSILPLSILILWSPSIAFIGQFGRQQRPLFANSVDYILLFQETLYDFAANIHLSLFDEISIDNLGISANNAYDMSLIAYCELFESAGTRFSVTVIVVEMILKYVSHGAFRNAILLLNARGCQSTTDGFNDYFFLKWGILRITTSIGRNWG